MPIPNPGDKGVNAKGWLLDPEFSFLHVQWCRETGFPVIVALTADTPVAIHISTFHLGVPIPLSVVAFLEKLAFQEGAETVSTPSYFMLYGAKDSAGLAKLCDQIVARFKLPDATMVSETKRPYAKKSHSKKSRLATVPA